MQNANIHMQFITDVVLKLTLTSYLCLVCFSDTVEEDDDLYDFVEDEENEGDEIYEDLMRTDEQPETVSGAHTTVFLKQKGS